MKFSHNKKSILIKVLHPRKLFVMLLCFGFMLYLYATYASGKLKAGRRKIIQSVIH